MNSPKNSLTVGAGDVAATGAVFFGSGAGALHAASMATRSEITENRLRL
ncbi:MAG: hypothetical protein IPK97_05880 [Ahniella sp.]|nr:hypothetical protein [Ahniella sp.]